MSDRSNAELLELAGSVLVTQPSRELLGTIEQVALWIREFETQAQSSPKRDAVRKRLLEIAGCCNTITAALEEDMNSVSDLSIGKILRMINAQWVARTGATINAAGMRALEQGVRSFANEIPKGPARAKVSDSFDRPRGRRVCAIAVIELFEAVLGAKPGHSNPDAQRLCALIWELSGGPTMPGQQGDDNNDSAWGRHLREAPKGDKPALVEIRGLLSGIFRENGLVRKGQSGN